MQIEKVCVLPFKDIGDFEIVYFLFILLDRRKNYPYSGEEYYYFVEEKKPESNLDFELLFWLTR